ncbi:DUF4167 domain-containing protein [Sphingomonas aracearum]
MNNRQSGGRRRGRGGQQQRSQGNPGRPDNGNRIDNRARGNAAQLLEKYKTLARDAQMQGDRVNTEYYLQFADHYFRVLSESRARFEEANPNQQPQKPIRGATLDEDDFAEDGDETPVREERAAEDRGNREQASREQASQERPREERGFREERGPREDRGQRAERQPRRHDRAEERVEAGADQAPVAQGEAGVEGEPMTAEATPLAEKPRRRRARREEPRNEGDAPGGADAETAGFDAALLPPSISLPQGLEGEPVEIKPRRRRTRAASEDVAAAE